MKDGLYSVEEMSTKGKGSPVHVQTIAYGVTKRIAAEMARRGAFRTKTGKNGPILKTGHTYRYLKDAA